MRLPKTRQPGARFPSTESLKQLGRIFLFGTLLLALASCATSSRNALQQHTLAGKVWGVDAQRFVDSGVLLDRALSSDIVLLGETHDNPEHHRVQDWLLKAAINRGPVSALVMEQYDVDQQRDIDAIVNAPLAQGEKLQRLGKMMGPGWEWSGYRALVASALQRQTPLVAANISRDALRNLSRTGFAALGATDVERLALHTGWSEAQQKQLEKEIFDGHCGKLPAAAVAAISKAQRVRDAVIADKLLAVGPEPVIAILGRGHVRGDLAVPVYLATRAPGKRVLSVGIVEAGTSQEPADYAFGALGKLYDYVVFTRARARESDPCDGIVMPDMN